MKKYTKLIAINVMAVSLFSFGGSAFAEGTDVSSPQGASTATTAQHTPMTINSTVAHTGKAKGNFLDRAATKDEVTYIKGQIQQLRQLNKQDMQLNQQMRDDLKAAKQRIITEIKNQDGTVNQEKLNEDQAKVNVLKQKITAIRDYKQTQKDHLIEGIRESVKNRDFENASSQIENANTVINQLMTMKKDLITYLNSL